MFSESRSVITCKLVALFVGLYAGPTGVLTPPADDEMTYGGATSLFLFCKQDVRT